MATRLEIGGAPGQEERPLLSDEWMESFARAPKGCEGPAIYPYPWRVSGYGSNTIHLLLAWAHAVVEHRGDLALIVPTARFFPRTTCGQGAETRLGWECMYTDVVPHLCTFNTAEDWLTHNERQGIASSEKLAAIDRYKLTHSLVVNQTASVEESLANTGVDMLQALAMLYGYLQSFRQPWFEADIQGVLDEPPIAALRRQPYVSMHIRRADKKKEARPTNTTVYFDKVVKLLASGEHGGGLTASDVEGLWLSSDDDAVFDEVKQLAPEYFPRVKPEAVLYVTNRVPTRATDREEAAAERNSYEAMVLLHAELHMLAGARVFCGTYTSNFGSVVALMRESMSLPRGSALSADSLKTRTLFAGWVPGRRRPAVSPGRLGKVTTRALSLVPALVFLSVFICLFLMLLRLPRPSLLGAVHRRHRLRTV